MKISMKSCFGAMLIVNLCLLFGTVASADIYMYVDDTGMTHFTDVPQDGRYKRFMRDKNKPGNFVIQTTPFKSIKDADSVKSQLISKGEEVSIRKLKTGKNVVQFGNYSTTEHADIFAKKYVTDNVFQKYTIERLKNNPKNKVEVKPDENIGYYVQIGTFKNKEEAERLNNKLNSGELYSYIYKEDDDKYMVWFGDYKNKEDALKEAKRQVSKKLFRKYQISISQKQLDYLESQKPKRPDSSRLTGEARKMEIYLNSKSFRNYFVKTLMAYQNASANFTDIPVEYYYAKCSDPNSPIPVIECSLFFPGKWRISDIPKRYVHFMEMLTRDVVHSFSKEYQTDFSIGAAFADYPICNFWYVHQFDQFGRGY